MEVDCGLFNCSCETGDGDSGMACSPVWSSRLNPVWRVALSLVFLGSSEAGVCRVGMHG